MRKKIAIQSILGAMGATDEDDINIVVALERRLFQPEVRASAVALDTLLDPEFREIGASGRSWTRDGTIAALTGEAYSAAARIRDEDMDGRRLADNLVMLTYVSDESGRRAHRTSLWRLDRDLGWRLLHHQGTLLD
jgi:hypothetical protein